MGMLNISQPSTKIPDASETIHISSLALLKMLKHGRAGIPIEVMGLMLGEYLNDYTVKVVDVFAMPQSGTGTTVEAVDPVYQMNMLNALEVTGRHEKVVGWYHSHPGFGCWLSQTDMSTQSSFEQLNRRAVAVVIDPIQSVKGKVVIDAFRLINQRQISLNIEHRAIFNNIAWLNEPTLTALLHGLNRYYYSFYMCYTKNEMEKRMLLNLNRKNWTDYLKIEKIRRKDKELLENTEDFMKMAEEIKNVSDDEINLKRIGKIDFRKKLNEICDEIYEENSINSILVLIHSNILGIKVV